MLYRKLRQLAMILMLGWLLVPQQAEAQCAFTTAYVQFRCIGYKMLLDSIYVGVNNPPASGYMTITYAGTGKVDSFAVPFSPAMSKFPNSQFPNINGPGINSGPGSGSSLTICFTAAPGCCITIPYGDLFACYCNASAGTVSASMNASNQSNNNYILCIDDEVTISSNSDYSFNVQPPFPAPALAYGIYKCPPTPGVSPVLDTCLVGVTPNATSITIQNLYGSKAPGLLAAFPGAQNNTLYFAPIVLYNGSSNPRTINVDCWDVGPATAVVFLDSITYTMQQNCLSSGIDVTIQGGSPALYGGNYSLTNLTPAYATLSTNSLANGGTVTVGNLNNGDNFSFTVTDPNGCSITINDGPYVAPVTAAFKADSVCVGNSTTFTDQSTGTVTGWNWDFGNASGTSTQQNPTYSYGAAGTYTVKLIVQNSQGCKDSVTQQVYVYASPTVDFTFDSVCLGDQTCFKDKSGGSITAWQWVFGDGSPVSNAQNPCHSYATAGSYNSTLIVTTGDGCTGTLVKTVDVFAVPTAAFTATDVCEGSLASFTDQSTPLGSVTGWNWNFGDGNSSTVQNPTHNYANSGSFNVKLVTSVGTTGCKDSITQTVNIFPSPTADFTFTNVCLGDPMPFVDNSSVTGGGTITGWNWSFGDGNTSTQQNPSNTYPASGNYNVRLIVTSSNNCVDTITKQVTVFDAPQADFNFSTACEGDVTQFTDNTTGNVANWVWSFGDGGNSNVQNPTHTYLAAGTYTVKLIVSSGSGCIDSITKQVDVNPLPVVDFTPDTTSGCSPVCVNFTNNSSISAGSIATYKWYLGDGTITTDTNVTHCYNNDGVTVKMYDVSLVAVSAQGCRDSVNKASLISCYPIPVADFTWSPSQVTILNPDFEYYDRSIGASQWYWEFGDGATSNSQNPTHSYSDTGHYATWLYIENQYGCADTTWKILEVLPEVFYYIPNAFTVTGDGLNDKWFPKGIGVAEQEIMIFDRWGELIFHGHDLDSKWDGTYKDQKVKTGVYVYKIKMLDVLGKDHTYIGKVTLLK